MDSNPHIPKRTTFETYIKGGKTCKYLYRAVDKEGNTIEFTLSAKRDVTAAKRAPPPRHHHYDEDLPQLCLSIQKILHTPLPVCIYAKFMPPFLNTEAKLMIAEIFLPKA